MMDTSFLSIFREVLINSKQLSYIVHVLCFMDAKRHMHPKDQLHACLVIFFFFSHFGASICVQTSLSDSPSV